METLVDIVSNCIEAHSPMGYLGYRYREEEEGQEAFADLIVYPTPVELVGGSEDGAIVYPGFSFDLQSLLSAFERVDALHWCAHSMGPHDIIGPHLSLEGIYQGHRVWLRVLSDPPEDEEPGMQFDVSGQG